ncbi:OmpA family protein [Zoogloea sp. 1C4]|jgi:outer membrane protein OmpA-like peptidoglycan-associated protein|uniref:OmpA family protein n=1 Tax=Zoogloea sp. 1C4 TaxID=2570190 RepID=UPI001885315D|nr:OmpA family protein [Zoogloea sp. 1C4]
MLKSLMISTICLASGVALAADNSGDVVELNESVAPEVIESGLFPKSSITAACEEAAKAGFTCGQIVPRKVFSLPSNISFTSGSAQLSDAAKSLLASFGPVLKRNEASGSSVIFIGHTDITGSKRLNQNLSERRAEAVRQYFISSFGISPSFLKASGVGSAQLKDKGNPSSSVNRRVEISTTSGK